jgi:hypothetical protein
MQRIVFFAAIKFSQLSITIEAWVALFPAAYKTAKDYFTNNNNQQNRNNLLRI